MITNEIIKMLYRKSLIIGKQTTMPLRLIFQALVSKKSYQMKKEEK